MHEAMKEPDLLEFINAMQKEVLDQKWIFFSNKESGCSQG
jgi:hypothetical protein